MRKNLLILLSFLCLTTVASSDYAYKFRLALHDKGETNYSIDAPQHFLSKKAIERRQKQNIPIDKSDLPISSDYLQSIVDIGGVVVAKSKWLETISVHCDDSVMVDALKALPFVKDVKFVWKGKKENKDYGVDYTAYDDSLLTTVRDLPLVETLNSSRSPYGLGEQNINMQNGSALHTYGMYGHGMDIAIMDAGFSNLHRIRSLSSVNIKAHRGFVYGGGSIFEDASEHGLNVLSCMAASEERSFVGTAPGANYILLATEDSSSEYPIEEDYWTAAAEYADSLGVDVINSSLGYNNFDSKELNFTHKDLDGKTAMISRAADMAVKKGMFVVCSAGNSGMSKWRKLTPPADAFRVLTVGAVRTDSIIAGFSSHGFTADLRIKPDVVALGQRTIVIAGDGELRYKNGTSFSSPIMAGLVACLWQAFPTLSTRELLAVIRESSNNTLLPNERYGYGIPDMEKAMALATIIRDKQKNEDAGSTHIIRTK